MLWEEVNVTVRMKVKVKVKLKVQVMTSSIFTTTKCLFEQSSNTGVGPVEFYSSDWKLASELLEGGVAHCFVPIDKETKETLVSVEHRNNNNLSVPWTYILENSLCSVFSHYDWKKIYKVEQKKTISEIVSNPLCGLLVRLGCWHVPWQCGGNGICFRAFAGANGRRLKVLDVVHLHVTFPSS